MPVVPFIPAIIGGVAGVAGAKIASNATKDATKTSAEASNRAAEIEQQTAREALAENRRMYEQDRADNAPFRALGGGAVGGLGYLAGLGGFESGQAPKDPTSPQMATAGGTTNANGMTEAGALRSVLSDQLRAKAGGGIAGGMLSKLALQVENAPDEAFASMLPEARARALSRTGRPLTELGMSGAIRQTMANQANARPGGPPLTQGGTPLYVLMRAPNGQQKHVPVQDVQRYLEAGAEPLGGATTMGGR